MNRTPVGSISDMPDREVFIQHLRYALVHLHEPDRLRSSPLAALLGLDSGFDTSHKLYAAIVEAVERLEPSDPDALLAEHEYYEILLYRYVQQMPQSDVADQLGMGVRHLRRKQRAAFEALADTLWAQRPDSSMAPVTPFSSDATSAKEGSSSLTDELTWLGAPETDYQCDLRSLIESVVEMIRPHADSQNASLRTFLKGELPCINVNPVPMRQLVVTLLSIALEICRGANILLSAKAQEQQVVLTISGIRTQVPSDWHEEAQESSFALAHRLAQALGVPFEATISETKASLSLHVPILLRTKVLVIDDNKDFLELAQRFVTGTRYQLITTHLADRAVEIALREHPGAIVLDIMMPEMDGWELLRSILDDQRLCNIPIIVSSIVANPALAKSLGANGCLIKPVSREGFLAELDRLTQIPDQAAEAHSRLP